jgi:hypothetical protein
VAAENDFVNRGGQARHKFSFAGDAILNETTKIDVTCKSSRAAGGASAIAASPVLLFLLSDM